MYDVLFAPTRGKYVGERPKVKCLFCAIRDHDPRVWTREIYRDEDRIVLMNIFPYSPGHIQVLPSKHVEDLEELSGEKLEYVLDFVQKGVSLIRKVMNPDGFNLGINLGKAGASIPHLHVQIVPRYKKKPPMVEQEEIHRSYLENAKVFKEKSVIKTKIGSCECFSELKYLMKKDPFVYLSEKPYNRGHVIVSPKEHVSDICELSTSDFRTLFEEVTKIKGAIEKVYRPVGINIGINMGEVANSSDHLQVHIVPRYDPESGFMEVVGVTRVVVDSLDGTYEKIKKALTD